MVSFDEFDSVLCRILSLRLKKSLGLLQPRFKSEISCPQTFTIPELISFAFTSPHSQIMFAIRKCVPKAG